MFAAITRKTITPDAIRCAVYASLALTITLIVGERVEAAGHAPTLSFLPNQYIQSGVDFPINPVYFRAWDPDGGTLRPGDIVPTVMNTEGLFYSPQRIRIDTCAGETGCPAQGGFKMQLLSVQNGDGAAAVTLTVTDNEGLQGTTSFTLRKNSAAVHPPLMAGIPSESIKKSQLFYGPVQFVIDDMDETGLNDAVDENGNSTVHMPTAISDNSDVVQGNQISFTPIAARTWVMNAPPTGVPGRAVVTVTATDKDFNPSDTSFVLNVIDDSGLTPNTPPSFNRTAAGVSGTWVEQTNTIPGSSTAYAFKVADTQTSPPALVVTATSSNADLVPNDSQHLSVSSIDSNGRGTLTITPLLPMSNLKAPQASTITLTVTDAPQGTSQTRAAYNSRLQFLFVMRDPSSAVPMFLRPTGIYNLNPDPEDHLDKPYITGEMRGITWRELETGDNIFNWQPLDNFFGQLAPSQVLSLNLQEEPCYIAQNADLPTWCDTNADPDNWGCNTCSGGVSRAVPWDPYLWRKRERFLQKLAYHLTTETNNIGTLQIINPNLPGGTTGIHEMLDGPLTDQQIPGYTRENFLAAVQHELRTVQDNFPGKLVQIGYFLADDDQDNNPIYGNTALWQWLYPYLANEFNGIVRPRVSFFQEDLASNRPSAAPDFIPYTDPPSTLPYTLFPDIDQLPSFEYYCDETGCTYNASTYNNGIVYQANTGWSSPLTNIDKTTKTLNSTPNDALEGAFNSFFNQYLEVYPGDLAHANTTATAPPWDAQRWQDGLQSWKDYTDHLRNDVLQLEAPAGLTVERTDASHNTIEWDGVYSPPDKPVSYHVQRQNGLSWTDVCNPTSELECDDNSSTGTAYVYRVWATNGTNPDSAYSYVAVFLSQGGNDGYITYTGQMYQLSANDSQPGIRAGRGALTELRGFLSFNTGTTLTGKTVVGAKLRLYQMTDNSGYDALGPCKVDIKKGYFGTAATLENTDFSMAAPTDFDVTQVQPLADMQVPPGWVEAEIVNPLYFGDINNTTTTGSGLTQFRLYFDGITTNQQVQWDSGETANVSPFAPPMLIVRYVP